MEMWMSSYRDGDPVLVMQICARDTLPAKLEGSCDVDLPTSVLLQL